MATQAIHNASKAFWSEVDALRGEQQAGQTTEQRVPQSYNEEPMAGVQGKGTISDPYDAGNRDEQPEAPISKENTAVVTEPLSSITPGTGSGAISGTGTGTGTFQDKYRRGSDKATLVTSGIGPTNPTIEHPAPVSGKQYASGPGAKSTLKDEPVGIHKSTLRDESLSGSRPIADEPQPTMATSKPSASATAAATAAAASTTGSTAVESSSEQRSQPSTSQSGTQYQKAAGDSSTTGPSTSQPEAQGTEGPRESSTTGASSSQAQTQGKEGAGQSSTTGTSASQGAQEGAGAQSPDDVAAMAKKKGVSEETLRGPKVAAPRESYEKQKKFSTAGLKEGESTDQPKTSKPEGKSTESGQKASDTQNASDGKDSSEPHHRSMKEKISDMLHHH